jgi:putative colanic acid biosynthesis acetyltransferase WcaF
VSSAILTEKRAFTGPTYSLRNRVGRVLWRVVWVLTCRWTPPPFHGWRVAMLRIFGARIPRKAYVYSSVRIWAPWNLAMGEYATLGPHVNCYNPAFIELAERAVVSQGSHLCTASHDIRREDFQLVARPIVLGRNSWVAAEAFVGPGVRINDGAVLAARGVAFRDIPAWEVWMGNPATKLRNREPLPEC